MGARAAAQRTALLGQRPADAHPTALGQRAAGEQLRGVRRNMARVMADAHSKVAHHPGGRCHIQAGTGQRRHRAPGARDLRGRGRGAGAQCRFDGDTLTAPCTRTWTGHRVDTADGLFVPALRNADLLDARGVRAAVDRLRAQVEDRSIPASELTATPSRCRTSACSPAATPLRWWCRQRGDRRRRARAHQSRRSSAVSSRARSSRCR